MSLIQEIQQLSTSPRHQEEEYESTSDFLEWFYYHLYRENAFSLYPVLKKVSMESEYQLMCHLCCLLINQRHAQFITTDTRVKLYEDMKRWILCTVQKYQEPSKW